MIPKMVISDFDGTLFSPQHSIHPDDIKTLHWLGKRKIVRIIATGRSMYSLQKVLPPDFPVDYIAFSSGAGILDWKTRKLLTKRQLRAAEVKELTAFLFEQQCDFMVHEPIPLNHRFNYFIHNNMHADFERRIKLYAPYAKRIEELPLTVPATQIIVIHTDGPAAHQKLSKALAGYNIIRTTSPLDGKTIWIEIFPRDVSKAEAANWLCSYLCISPNAVMAVGNDYNDRQLLDWAAISYIMETAPDQLKGKYRSTLSPAEAGFSKAVAEVTR